MSDPLDDDNDPRKRWPGNPIEALTEAANRIQKQHEHAKDRGRMQAEYTALVIRRFFEGLDREQLTTLTNLLAGLANEGKHNYMASTLYGLAIGYSWHNAEGAPLPETDAKFRHLAQGIEGMMNSVSPEAVVLDGGIDSPIIGHSLDEDPDARD